MSGSPKHFLVTPLDWGLGHAGRCVPVIRSLLSRNQRVTVAASGNIARMLAAEFRALPFVPVVNYGIRYGGGPVSLAARFPFMVMRVMFCALQEHRQARRLVGDLGVDAIISDNRFGFFTRTTVNVYISHQLCVLMPKGFGWLERLVRCGLVTSAGWYDRLWIPDYGGDDNLTGDLTRKYPLPPHHRFVGPLSRFAGLPADTVKGPGPDLLVMLSGPEPQRSMLEHTVIAQAGAFGGSVVVLRGLPGDAPAVSAPGHVTLVNHASSPEIGRLLRSAKSIVCRGGYSTIMELDCLGRSAVLVPTPGQSEQEYLCERMERLGRFVCAPQRGFSLALSLEKLAALPVRSSADNRTDGLESAVTELVDHVNDVPPSRDRRRAT